MATVDTTTEKPIRVGTYDSIPAAKVAVKELLRNGFTEQEITVYGKNIDMWNFFKDERPAKKPGPSIYPAAIGAGSGAVLGALIAAVFLFSSFESVAIAAGTVAGALTGAVVGGLLAVMLTRGLEKEPADYFAQSVPEGKVLVSVEPVEGDSGARLQRAAHVLEETGAEPYALPEG